MKKRWEYKAVPKADLIKKLSEVINVSAPIATILGQRGIKTFEDAKSFFRPELSHLHDPFLMIDMDLAVSRILGAIENEERIMVFGDYDVDGTTSVAVC